MERGVSTAHESPGDGKAGSRARARGSNGRRSGLRHTALSTLGASDDGIRSELRSGDLLQPVLVPQAAEDGRGFDLVSFRNLVTVHGWRRWWVDGRWDAGNPVGMSAPMWAPMIVIGHPLVESHLEVSFSEGNQEIQTFPPYGAN